MKHFMVVCERGHCGIKRSTEIKFAIIAENLLHACAIARKMPSVKHSRPILYGYEITEKEYLKYKQMSAYDRYPQENKRRRRY